MSLSLVTGLGISGLPSRWRQKTRRTCWVHSRYFLINPFVSGDQVKGGPVEGKIKRRFRSARIRALDRMLVTVPTKKMVTELISETDARCAGPRQVFCWNIPPPERIEEV